MENSEFGIDSKKRAKETSHFFVLYLIPMSCLIGYSLVTAQSNANHEGGMLALGVGLCVSLLIVHTIYELRTHNIRGWFAVACIVGAMITQGLTIWYCLASVKT
jgi:uncharacterized membrane protein